MKTISQNELQSRETPGDGWYVIEAAGRHPARMDGREFVQNLAADALAAVAAAGVPAEGLPIDRDHLSMDSSHGTEAVGWVRELAACDGDLAARIEWTPLGLPLIQGRIYKHFSTVYPPDAEQMAAGEYTPTRLIGLALTNQPNNKQGQPPITNRGKAEQTTESTKMEYPPELLAALGLAEGATDEEVIAAVQAAKRKADEAEAAACAAAEAEADSVINAAEKEAGAALDDEEKKEAKEQLLTNRAHGLKYVKLLCNSKRPQPPQQQPARRYPDRSEEKPLANRAPNSEVAIANRARRICEDARRAGRPIDYYTGLKRARSEAESASNN